MTKDTKKNFNFIITEKRVKKATKYVPLAEKMGFSAAYAPDCLKEVEISVQKLQGDSLLALPPLWAENIQFKQMYLLRAFLEMYVHIEFAADFPSKEYDKYAASHPFNHLERLKNNPELRDIVFDILTDFKELKKLFDIEIYNLKAARNDGMERALAGISIISSPEAIKAMTDEMQKLAQTIEKGKQTAKKTKKPPAVKQLSAKAGDVENTAADKPL